MFAQLLSACPVYQADDCPVYSMLGCNSYDCSNSHAM